MERNNNAGETRRGLAAPKNLSGAMTGTIDVVSKYDKGGAITAKLPHRVKSPMHTAAIENAGSKHVLVLERRKKLIHSIIQTIDGLGVRFKLVSAASEFHKEISRNNYTHVLAAAGLYELAKKEHGAIETGAKIMLIAELGETVEERNIRVLTTPVYSIPVVDFLNDISKYAAGGTARGKLARFIAPGARILSVDDVSINLNVLEELLREYEAEVVSCESGKEAIEAIKDASFDLVFMDHLMPEMDGIETVEQLRVLFENEAEKRAPIIALSANANANAKEMFLENGFDDFLPKPIDLTKLRDVLLAWIPEHKWEIADENHAESGEESAGTLEIKGINVETGLLRTGGSLSNFKKTLRIFIKDSIEKEKEIRQSLENEDLRLFTIHVHALKSAAAIIGAENLSWEAELLEEAGRVGNGRLINSGAGEFLAELEALRGNIESALNALNEPAQPAGLDKDFINAELCRLKAAIDSFDSAAIKRCTENLQQYTQLAEIGAEIDKILHSVIIGDDERAISLLDSALDDNNLLNYCAS